MTEDEKTQLVRDVAAAMFERPTQKHPKGRPGVFDKITHARAEHAKYLLMAERAVDHMLAQGFRRNA